MRRALLVFGAVALFFVGSVVQAQDEEGNVHESLIGQPAPEIVTATSMNGSNSRLSELKGKVVMLDFWAVWCGPCVATFPHLNELNARYKNKGLEIVGLTSYYKKYDFKGGKLQQAKTPLSEKQEQAMLKAFATHHKLKHRLAIMDDDGRKKTYADYGVRGIPQVVLIDREGIVRMIKVGAGKQTAKEIEDEIKKLLASSDTAGK